MKNILIVLSLVLLSSCHNEKLDMNAATKTAENAIQLIGDKKFDDLSKLYTKDFAASEDKEAREKKYAQIINATGNVVEFKITDSTRVNNTGEESHIVLKYNVKHARVSTSETYSITLEDGKYLISEINITNK